jgi:hypothetical protein
MKDHPALYGRMGDGTATSAFLFLQEEDRATEMAPASRQISLNRSNEPELGRCSKVSCLVLQFCAAVFFMKQAHKTYYAEDVNVCAKEIDR